MSKHCPKIFEIKVLNFCNVNCKVCIKTIILKPINNSPQNTYVKFTVRISLYVYYLECIISVKHIYLLYSNYAYFV
jgi:hypothetical protein